MRTKHQRFKYLIEEVLKPKAIQEKIAADIGVSASALSQAKIDPKGKYSKWLGKDKLQKLSELYNVNLEWLKTGKGPILIGGDEEESADIHPEPSAKGTIFPTLRKHGERALMYGKSNVQPLPILIDHDNEEWVVVVPEYALASYSEGSRDPNFIRELPKETIPDDLRNRGTIRKFQVYGDSMEPEFYHGDWVYTSFVEITRPEHLYKIRDRNLYVIVTRERGAMLKRIGYLDGDDFIQCYSVNESHKAFPLHIGEIQEFWYVRRRYTGAFYQRPDAVYKEIAAIKTDVHKTNERLDRVSDNMEVITKSLSTIAKAIAPDKDINLG